MAEFNGMQGKPLENISVELREWDIFAKGVLEGLMEMQPQSVIVLANRSLPDEQSDARALMMQLRLYDLDDDDTPTFSVAVEMRDSRNQGLAPVSSMTDYIVSGKLNALIMAQVADERSKRAILADLLDKEGSTIYMKSIQRYVTTDRPVDFYTLGASAARYGEIAIGYKKFAEDGSFTIEVNPKSREKKQFRAEDDLIVITKN